MRLWKKIHILIFKILGPSFHYIVSTIHHDLRVLIANNKFPEGITFVALNRRQFCFVQWSMDMNEKWLYQYYIQLVNVGTRHKNLRKLPIIKTIRGSLSQHKLQILKIVTRNSPFALITVDWTHWTKTPSKLWFWEVISPDIKSPVGVGEHLFVEGSLLAEEPAVFPTTF